MSYAALWLSWWVDTKSDADLAKWLCLYAAFGILELAFLGISSG